MDFGDAWCNIFFKLVEIGVNEQSKVRPSLTRERCDLRAAPKIAGTVCVARPWLFFTANLWYLRGTWLTAMPSIYFTLGVFGCFEMC